jgi:hypothetical protein
MKTYLKWERVLAFLMACFALTSSIFVYEEVQLLGFPDGFLTELDQAERILANFFIWISFPTSLWLVFLSWIASQQKIRKKLCITIVLYIVLVTLLSVIDFYLRQHLKSGGGG